MGSDGEHPSDARSEIRHFDVVSEWYREQGCDDEEIDRLGRILSEIADFMAEDKAKRAVQSDSPTAAAKNVVGFPKRERRRDS